MKPADIGNWSLLQVFQEGGRLLRQEFRKFWPCIVVVILPASLITVMHAQFAAVLPPKAGPKVYIQGSTDLAEPKLDYFHLFFLIFSTLLFASPFFLVLMSMVWMSVTLTNTIYNDEAVETTRHTESIRHSSDLRCGCRRCRDRIGKFCYKEVAHKNPALLTTKTKRPLVGGIPRASKEKKLKTLAVTIVLRLLYYLGEVTGELFMPEAVAAMGLPSWMVFVFTLLITVMVTVFNAYLVMVYLLVFTWLGSPSSELCGFDTSYLERGKCSELGDTSSPLLQSKNEV